MPSKFIPFILCLVSLALSARAAAATPAKVDFDKEIAPLLKAHCFECHTGDEPEGELHLGFKNGAEAVDRARQDRAIFEKMAELLRHHEMPPEDFKAQPTEQNRQRLIAWIENDLLAPDPKSVRHSGHGGAFNQPEMPAQSSRSLPLKPETKSGPIGSHVALAAPTAPHEATPAAPHRRQESPPPLPETPVATPVLPPEKT